MQTKAVYTAPWPKGQCQEPPPGLRGGIFFPKCVVIAAQKYCSNIIAQRLVTTTLEKVEEHRTKLFQNPQFSQVEIETPDGVPISTAFSQGSVRKVILFIPGLNDCYEMLDDEKQVPARFFNLFRELLGDISIMVLNRRGLNRNSAMPTVKGLALDVYSAARYLIDKKEFTLKDLLIWGHSFGGMYGAHGATLLQKEFPQEEVSIVADRSFLSLTKLVEEHLNSRLKGKIAELFIRFAQWDMKSHDDFTALKGKKIIIYTQADETVPYAASIHKLIKELDIKEMMSFEMDKEEPSDWHHIRQFTTREKEALSKILRSCLHMENAVV